MEIKLYRVMGVILSARSAEDAERKARQLAQIRALRLAARVRST